MPKNEYAYVAEQNALILKYLGEAALDAGGKTEDIACIHGAGWPFKEHVGAMIAAFASFSIFDVTREHVVLEAHRELKILWLVKTLEKIQRGSTAALETGRGDLIILLNRWVGSENEHFKRDGRVIHTLRTDSKCSFLKEGSNEVLDAPSGDCECMIKPRSLILVRRGDRVTSIFGREPEELDDF